jgi:hypothetical protein
MGRYKSFTNVLFFVLRMLTRSEKNAIIALKFRTDYVSASVLRCQGFKIYPAGDVVSLQSSLVGGYWTQGCHYLSNQLASFG